MSLKNIFKTVIGVAVAIFALSIFFGAWFTIDSGRMVVYQNPTIGTVIGYTEPGIYFSVPIISSVSHYNRQATVNFTSGGKEDQDASYSGGPMEVRFPDNYTGTIEATFRFEFPTDGPSLVLLHEGFKGYQSTVNRLLVQTAKDVMTQAASQYTSEDFFQGGLPSYKAKLIDFLNNGTPVLEKRQVELNRASITEEGADANGSKTKKQKQYVEIFAPKMGTDGKILRSETPLKQYGIRVVQVTLSKPTPAADLDNIIKRTKQIFADRRAIRAEQENERQARITAKLKGERATEEASQLAELEKAVAVVNAEKKTELARQEKNRVIVQRNQELEKSKLERAIQSEKVQSAKLRAVAIEAEGMANARVEAAMMRARNNPVYLAEIQKEMAIKVTENMKGITINMPSMVIGGGGGGAQTSVGVINELLSAQLALQMNPNLRNSNRVASQ